jgi:hypothetical protein
MTSRDSKSPSAGPLSPKPALAPDEDSRGSTTTIRYDAAMCGNDSVNAISNRILAGFFDMELIDQPSLTSSPEICLFRVRCRVQPGLAFLNFLRQFQQSRIYFRGDDPNYYVSHLLSPDTLQCINYSEEFTRILEVTVSSMACDKGIHIRFLHFINQSGIQLWDKTRAIP